MTTNDLSQEEGIDCDALEWAHTAGIFGIDEHGIAHRYSRARNTVYLTRNRKCIRVERLDEYDGDIADWIDFVAVDVGWIDEWFSGESGMLVTVARLQAAREAAD